MADVFLKTTEGVFGGWTSMRLSLSMEHCANRFEIELTEMWPDQQQPRRILPWDGCEVLLGDQVVITGYVDELDVEHNDQDHALRVTGRDKTSDLVDCSAVAKTGQWRGLKIEQIAEQLAKPFGIKVRADVNTGAALPSFAVQEGESAFEAIERAARMRALLLMSDGQGRLLITRAGTARVDTPLVLGVNIAAGGVRYDVRDRYSDYVVKGQSSGRYYEGGDAALVAKQAASAKAMVKDTLVPRYRPLVMTGECQDVGASLGQRVQWEANVRAARSTQVQIDLRGWEHDGGLWRPNALVYVQDRWLGIDGELLISAVDFTLSEDGRKTTLHLTNKDAFAIDSQGDGKKGGAASHPVSWWDKK